VLKAINSQIPHIEREQTAIIPVYWKQWKPRIAKIVARWFGQDCL